MVAKRNENDWPMAAYFFFFISAHLVSNINMDMESGHLKRFLIKKNTALNFSFLVVNIFIIYYPLSIYLYILSSIYMYTSLVIIDSWHRKSTNPSETRWAQYRYKIIYISKYITWYIKMTYLTRSKLTEKENSILAYFLFFFENISRCSFNFDFFQCFNHIMVFMLLL